MPDLGGLKLQDYRGKVVLLHFWAGWCEPCLKQIPMFNELSKEYGGAGLAVLGGWVASKGEKLKKDLPKPAYPSPKVDESTFESYVALLPKGVKETMPVAMVIDTDGVIRQHFPGTPTRELLEAALKSLLPPAALAKLEEERLARKAAEAAKPKTEMQKVGDEMYSELEIAVRENLSISEERLKQQRSAYMNLTARMTADQHSRNPLVLDFGNRFLNIAVVGINERLSKIVGYYMGVWVRRMQEGESVQLESADIRRMEKLIGEAEVLVGKFGDAVRDGAWTTYDSQLDEVAKELRLEARWKSERGQIERESHSLRAKFIKEHHGWQTGAIAGFRRALKVLEAFSEKQARAP